MSGAETVCESGLEAEHHPQGTAQGISRVVRLLRFSFPKVDQFDIFRER